MLAVSVSGIGLMVLASAASGAAPSNSAGTETASAGRAQPKAVHAEAMSKGHAKKERTATGKEVTMTGPIQDLAGFMTGQYATTDHAKCAADALRAGQPAVIHSSSGVVLIGVGATGVSARLASYALQTAQLRGRLFQKNGLTYLEVTTVEKPTVSAKSTSGAKTGGSVDRGSGRRAAAGSP